MKKLYFIMLAIFLLFFSLTYVNADVLVKERTKDNHYGVNKKWNINSSNISNVMNTEYVDETEKIYDFANILTETEIVNLKTKVDKFISKYNMELVIVTVDKPYFYDSSNETYASDFYDYNDFGLNYEKYDGIIIYRNANKYYPYYGVYMFGDAQLYIDETRYNEVLDDVYNDIHDGNYLVGFSDFIDHLDGYMNKGIPYSMKYKYVDSMGYLQDKFKPPYFLAFIISLVVTLIVINIMISKNKMVKKETKADIYLDMESINFTVRKNNYSHSRTTSVVVSSSSSGGHSGGGGHSSSGSSGGGHSGGGRRG